jgi:hypothetical protein
MSPPVPLCLAQHERLVSDPLIPAAATGQRERIATRSEFAHRRQSQTRAPIRYPRHPSRVHDAVPRDHRARDYTRSRELDRARDELGRARLRALLASLDRPARHELDLASRALRTCGAHRTDRTQQALFAIRPVCAIAPIRAIRPACTITHICCFIEMSHDFGTATGTPMFARPELIDRHADTIAAGWAGVAG